MQADAAGNAAGAQVQGGRDAIQAQLAMYNQSRADTLPYQTTGTGALNLLAQLYGLPTYQGGADTGGIQIAPSAPAKKKSRSFFDKVTDPANLAKQFGGTSYDPMGFFSGGGGDSASPLQFTGGGGGGGQVMPGSGMADFSSFWQTPDYLVARDEGLRGNDRALAARGALGPGAGDADRIQFASNLGTQQFGNFTNNLFRLAGLGGQGNQQLNSLGQNVANQTGNLLGNIGEARASSYANQSNAWGNALGQAGQAAGQYFGQRSVAPTQTYAAPSGQFAGSFGNNTGWLNGGPYG